MKPLHVSLVILLIILQYQLWFGAGGLIESFRLQRSIASLQAKNGNLQNRNNILINAIGSLKHSRNAIETQARDDLGMIKKDEVFYQVVK
jgi:cell division protein FtsB